MKEGFCDERDIYHELLHTIGLLHEHRRDDRDEYVKFNPNNLINPSKTVLKNFRVIPNDRIDKLGLEYNLKSIMHYRHDQGAKEGTSTLEPVDEMVGFDCQLPSIMKFNCMRNSI